MRNQWLVFLTMVMLIPSLTGCFAEKQTEAKSLSRQQSGSESLLQHRVQLAKKLEASGVMNSQDFLKWEDITNNVVKTGIISNDDLNWMLTLMQKPQSPTNDPQLVHGDVLGTLTHLKQIPEAQKEKIYNAALPLLSSDKKMDKMYAAKILRKLNDKKAVPYIKPLLSDPDPDVQQQARRVLKDLG